MQASPRRERSLRPGFTLIEVMAAVLLSGIVMSIAVAFQINLGSATDAARERLRTQRLAVALLDRISHDLASTYFIAPSERVIAGVNPWVFVTGREYVNEESSDKIKFITRNYQPQSLDGHSSDLAVVAYYLVKETDRRGYKLMRWRETHMPEQFDPNFPALDDINADVIGENLASFVVSLIDSNGSEVSEWYSVHRKGRDSLPVAVRLEITMLNQSEIDSSTDPDDFDSDGFDEFDEFDEEPDTFDDLEIDDEGYSDRKVYSKLVILPLRPLDWSFLEAEVRTQRGGITAGEGDDDDESGNSENDPDFDPDIDPDLNN